MTGPSVVAIGGGHGLAASLRAVRTYATDITAVVSVADDGGSSGRLRAEMPTLPAPGDVRRCLWALADERSALGRTLEHRFDGVDGLCGHAFGNLLLAALTAEMGTFGAAVDEVSRLVGAAGRVCPATTVPVVLEAVVRCDEPDADATRRVVGQVAVQNCRALSRLSLHPPDARAPKEAIDAIGVADQVVLGPGSLFTSVLAAAIVPEVSAALRSTRAQVVYVANLGAREPETDGCSLEDHVAVLVAHGIRVDAVVVDRHAVLERTGSASVSGLGGTSAPVTTADVADDRGLTHQPDRLGAVLASLLPAGRSTSLRRAAGFRSPSTGSGSFEAKGAIGDSRGPHVSTSERHRST